MTERTPSHTASATGSSASASEQHSLNDSSGDTTLALNSFNLSLVSDTSGSADDGPNISGYLDTLLSSSSPPCPTATSTRHSFKLLPHGTGLGISGLTRKDESRPFDGLGLVSIKSSPWRHDDLPQSEVLRLGNSIDQSVSIQGFNSRRQFSLSSSSSSTYDGSSESEDSDLPLLAGDAGISDVFLREALLTFTQDPFHQLCHGNVVSSNSIPDYENNKKNCSELGLGDELASESTSMSELSENTTTHSANDDLRPQMMLNYRHRRIPKLNMNFSSATISSNSKSTVIFPQGNWRNRSSSWPSSTIGDSISATPLARCKWRL